jgi:nucleoside 2-deoxyribosyltransferase
MEYVADHGVEWRRKFIKLSRQNGLRLDFIDPTNKPGGGRDSHIGENQSLQATMQREGRFEELKEYVHKYRRLDLRFVDNCDFIVAVIDPTVPQWGTGNEVYTAESQHKPMFFICENGLYKLPRWLFDVVPLDCVFTSVEDVVEHLVSLDMGEKELDDKWVLVRKFLEEMREDACDSQATVERFLS